ncbi:imelysin family protein [uncultured Roseobacter sp.]|uniref:imelysin family protein n=1 Tax=uncultured Roseobacter sp. TaxID=114847 RepID=UPI0026028F12|nr:imelysin family protein [uncultured Roseobacter sp.]
MTLRSVTFCCAIILCSPAFADLIAVRDDHILPRYAAFAEAAGALEASAETDCTAAAVLAAYHAAYDAWIGVSHIQFGPIEARGTALSLSFWPDPKDRTGKAMTRLIASQDPVVANAEAFAQVSVAAQGFFALERLLTEPQDNVEYACTYTRAISGHIAQAARDLSADWQGDFGETFVTPGAAGNTTYLSPGDADRAVYTALSTALEFMHDQRLGRPLGTFDRPRPNRAEARRSGRSARHVVLSLEALQEMTNAFSEAPLPEANSAFTAAIDRVQALEDPSFAGVAVPAERFKIEVLQRNIRDLQVLIADDIGAALGISAGFNALDGD